MPAAGPHEPAPDPSGLLISDADRDQLAAVLGEHMAEGRLTEDELEQRVGALYEARTRGQAAAVMAGLPALNPPAPAGHFHIGHDDEQSTPALPSWLTADGLVGEQRPAAVPMPPGGPVTPPAPSPAVSAALPGRGAQDKAAARRRAKLRADENAIGHAFQARRRAITSALERATAAGDGDDVARLNVLLREAKDAADAGRRAVAAGDRAEAQRQLQRLRRPDL
jgi:hypothetical protein